MEELIREYFRWYQDKPLERRIFQSLSDDRCFKRFVGMGKKYDFGSPVSRSLRTHDWTLIGLEGFSANQAGVRDFVEYAWSELYNYELNRGVPYGEYQMFNANRQLAYQSLTQLLGLGHLVPFTTLVHVVIYGQLRFGTLQDPAMGVRADSIDYRSRCESLCPALVRELTSLNVLDCLAHECDHRNDNYNIVIDNSGHAVGVSAFDNDSPRSFFPTCNVEFETYAGCASLVRSGRYNRRSISDKIFDSIAAVSWRDLSLSGLRSHLSEVQLRALWLRLRGLRAALKASYREGSLLVLGDEDQRWLNCIDGQQYTYVDHYLEGKKNVRTNCTKGD